MAAEYEMRVSDAEREAAAAELRDHFASGRLNQEELDERLSQAFAARTRGDLNALFADLPSSGYGSRSGAGASWPPPGGSDAYAGWQGRGPGLGRGLARAAFTTVLMWVLLVVGVLGVFGIGTGRPFGIVLIIAAFALLRRLLFIIFGRRGPRGRGPHGPRRGRRRY